MGEAKTDLVRAWFTRASHDLAAAERLAPDLGDIAVYHCQQAPEKAVKGFLVHHGVAAEKTHDVGSLVERAGEIEPGFLSRLDAAQRLSPFATAFRYPGTGGCRTPTSWRRPWTTRERSTGTPSFTWMTKIGR
jgi:HEPN domain-containing protein